jgi:hypothetical protein
VATIVLSKSTERALRDLNIRRENWDIIVNAGVIYFLQQKYNYKHEGNNGHFVCVVCGRSFEKHRALSVHFSHCHVNQERLECHICKRVFIHQRSLHAHQHAPRGCPRDPEICAVKGRRMSNSVGSANRFDS